MAELNPYAPPPIIAGDPGFTMASLAPNDGLWRDGKQLVMLKEAVLPPRCVKSNQPTSERLKRNLVWYPPWIALTILIAWPIFLVLVLCLQKKATIQIGLSPEWIAKRKQRILIAWGVAALGLALFVGGIAWAEDGGAFAILASVFVFIGALIYGQYSTRMVHPSKVDDRFVYLNGVCPEYLADLPVWPRK